MKIFFQISANRNRKVKKICSRFQNGRMEKLQNFAAKTKPKPSVPFIAIRYRPEECPARRYRAFRSASKCNR